MNEIISKSFGLQSDEMAYLKLKNLNAGDKIVLIKDGLDIKIFVNNELAAQGNGRVPAFLDDVNSEFGGSFLADASIGENGNVDFIFYPRYISFSDPSANSFERVTQGIDSRKQELTYANGTDTAAVIIVGDE